MFFATMFFGRGVLNGKKNVVPEPGKHGGYNQGGGQNQKWPTCGQSGYVTPAVSGIPTAAEQGGKSEMAHLWAKWRRHPCRLRNPHRCRAGSKMRSGPLVGKVAMSPLPGKSEVAYLWTNGLRHPCRLGDPHRCRAGGKVRSGPLVGKVATSPLPSRGSPPLQSRGGKSEVAHLWAKWLRHPCRLRDPHRFTAGGKIRSGPLVGKVATPPLPSRGSPPLHSRGESEVEVRSGPLVGKVATSPLPSRGSPPLQSGGGGIRSGPLVGKVATSPLPSRGSPPLQSGGESQKWPTCGQSGYVTPAVSGIPTASEQGGKSEMAHLWAKWLRHPCRLRDPHRFTAGSKIRSGPLVGKVATSPLPCRGSPPLHSGRESEVEIRSGPLVGKVATSPLPSRGSPPLQRGGGIRSGPIVGKMATSPLPSRGSPPLHSGGQNQKWPTSGQGGYVTPAVSGIPTAAERGGESEVAHLWAKWLRHPCRLGDPHRFRAGGGGG